jgi:hypothetical protein
MFALLSPKPWIALALVAVLAFTHGLAYRGGRAAVRAKWDAEKVVQQQALIAAEKASRAKELALNAKVMEASNEARKRETALKADAARARSELDGLRHDNDNFRRILPSLADDAVRRYAATANDVLAECSRRYQGVAEAADGFASDSLMLQNAWPR